jgi:hypothetical protein
MSPLLPPTRIRRCSAKSRSFLRGPDGPGRASTWTAPALRQSYGARKNRDQTKISSDQSAHGLRGTPPLFRWCGTRRSHLLEAAGTAEILAGLGLRPY